MAWKEVTVEELAQSFGMDAAEVREKQRLTRLIKKHRQDAGLSQAALAKRVGVSQSRVAQIESGVGASRTSFDVLFHILGVLGYGVKITVKKAA